MKRLIAVLLLLSLASVARADRTAASLSYTDVNNAVNGGGPFVGPAANGETVFLPTNQTATWTSSQTLVISNNIKLVGGSYVTPSKFVNGTTIIGGGKTMLSFITNSDHHTATLSGITFLNDNTSYTIVLRGTARFNGTDGGFRFTNCRFSTATATGGNSYYMHISDYVTGVIDHCFYDIPTDGVAGGLVDWDMPAQPGYVGASTSVNGSAGTVTFTTTPPIVHWSGAHGLLEGQGIMFSGGTLPTGLLTNTVYYVKSPASTNFDLAATPLSATPVVISTAGSPTITATPTDNQPAGGFYSFAVPWNWGADFEAIYIEDCILQKNGILLSVADGPPLTGAGGGRVVSRHNSTWGQNNCHGFGESGGNTGGYVGEAYNNLILGTGTTPETGSKHGIRAGSKVIFNERYVRWADNKLLSFNTNRASNQETIGSLIGPSDGTNFFDQNARGGTYTWSDGLPNVTSYTPLETTTTSTQTLPVTSLAVASTTGFPASGTVYITTTSAGTQPFNYTSVDSQHFIGSSNGTGTTVSGRPVVGPLVLPTNGSLPGGTYAPVVFQLDGSSPGVPTDDRIGAVYANLPGSSVRFNAGGNFTLLGFGSGDPANKWRGFELRNLAATASLPESAGAQGTPPKGLVSGLITASTVSGSDTTLTILGAHDGTINGTCSPAPCTSGDDYELRFVVNGIGFPGGGPTPLSNGVATHAARPHYYALDSKGRDQYWSQQPYGLYYWNNKFCSAITGTNGILGATPNITDAVTAVGSNARFIQGGLRNSVRPGYPQISTPTAAQLRIGADWDSGTFGGVNKAGQKLNGDLASNILSNDSRTGPAGAWAATQAWGAPYPHPLVAGNSAPVINPFGNATFAVGVPGTATIFASGNPLPCLTQNNAPTWATFTNNLDGNGSCTGSCTISGTPPNTQGSVFSITITATNTSGPSASQIFSLTISPSSPPIFTSANNTTFQQNVLGTFNITVTSNPSTTIAISP